MTRDELFLRRIAIAPCFAIVAIAAGFTLGLDKWLPMIAIAAVGLTLFAPRLGAAGSGTEDHPC